MRINHNIAALNTYRQFNNANNAQSKSMEKLSSGLRINSAADDAAGLAISEKMRGQIRGLDQAGKNAQDSISMIQTAEGALNETNDILQRMRELGVQAGNDTNTTEDRGEIQKEINQLTSEVNRIGNTTEFNTQKLLNASSGSQVGGTPAVPGTAATTIASATDMSAASGNTASGEVTVSGTFTGTADETLTFERTATGWSIDGGNNDVTLTGNTFTYKGMTIDVSAADGDAATGDAWTQDLTAAVAGTPASGSGKSQFTAQIGANENQTITLEFEDMRAAALGITGTAGTTGFTSADTVTDGSNNAASEAALDVSTAANAGNAVTVIQSAIDKVSAERSKLGAYQNRLDHTINNLSTSSENLTAAESRIRDVDYALTA
ncbi:flagellin [Priestia megaterium]|uniref:flagellin N-terminal helical domain-containing protein n=1 Tax=Priestia megaterium TaxID=1404 RepID=UPI00203E5FE8|nr:flagellin [Priestia megaterium]MCM3150823.1 flagellin [Priestia megaterium]